MIIVVNVNWVPVIEILVNYVRSGYKMSGKLEMQNNIHRYDIAFSVLSQCIIYLT